MRVHVVTEGAAVWYEGGGLPVRTVVCVVLASAWLTVALVAFAGRAGLGVAAGVNVAGCLLVAAVAAGGERRGSA